MNRGGANGSETIIQKGRESEGNTKFSTCSCYFHLHCSIVSCTHPSIPSLANVFLATSIPPVYVPSGAVCSLTLTCIPVQEEDPSVLSLYNTSCLLGEERWKDKKSENLNLPYQKAVQR